MIDTRPKSKRYLPLPFIIWYVLLSSADLLLIFLLLSEPSLDILLLRRLLLLEFLLEFLDCRDFLECFDCRDAREFYLFEAAPDSCVTGLSPA